MASDTVDVKTAAKWFGCSERRVRTLLAQGRITAKKVDNAWLIQWPIQVTFGLRAPLRKFTVLTGLQTNPRAKRKEREG